MISKDKLIHGQYYAGKGKETSIARWNANTNQFYYIKIICSRTFIYSTNDFIPMEVVTWGTPLIVIEDWP